MGKYIIKRILYAALVMAIASMVAFFLIRLAPGNPARLMLGDTATEEEVAAMEEKMGLNKPIIVQFATYLNDVLHGDLGTSISYRMPCLDLISTRLPYTIQLALCALFVSLAIGLPMGITAAVKKGSFADFIAVFVSLLGQSLASVWVGIILILFFGVKLRILPTQGSGTILHIIMPAITLGLNMTAAITRQLRSSMYGVLQEDYITATYAKGISKIKINLKYALKNAIMPVITVTGSSLATMLAGSVVIENVFGWPGMGSLLMKSIGARDYPLVQAILLMSSMIFIVVNLLVDLCYAFIDPRVHLDG